MGPWSEEGQEVEDRAGRWKVVLGPTRNRSCLDTYREKTTLDESPAVRRSYLRVRDVHRGRGGSGIKFERDREWSDRVGPHQTQGTGTVWEGIGNVREKRRRTLWKEKREIEERID